MSFKAVIQEDPVYAKYVDIRKGVLATCPLEAFLTEAEALHAQRKMRSLTTARLSVKALELALTKDLAVRSRMVEMRVLFSRQRELVSTSMSACRAHLRTAYWDSLSSFASTEASRNAILDRVMQKGLDLNNRLNAGIETLDTFIKDVDQASFAARNLTELLKMTLDNKEAVS